MSPEAKHLVESTKLALNAAIAICKPGVEFKQIGATIQKVAEQNKLNVVRDFCGHGVGKVFHASPTVFHFKNNEWQGKMQVRAPLPFCVMCT